VTLDDHQYWALEIVRRAGIIVSVYFPEKVNEDTSISTESQNESQAEFVQATSTSSKNQSKTLTPIRSSRDLRLDTDEAGHSQFVRNRVIDNENLLVRIIKKPQCENRRNRLITAIADSRINGWAAAKNLDSQTCTRLVPFGETARVETCSSTIVDVSVKHTACGPQPFFNNLNVKVMS